MSKYRKSQQVKGALRLHKFDTTVVSCEAGALAPYRGGAGRHLLGHAESQSYWLTVVFLLLLLLLKDQSMEKHLMPDPTKAASSLFPLLSL